MKKVIKFVFTACDRIGEVLTGVMMYLGLFAGGLLVSMLLSMRFYEEWSWVGLIVYWLLMVITWVAFGLASWKDDQYPKQLNIALSAVAAVLWPVILICLVVFTALWVPLCAIVRLRDWAFNDERL